jgi:penicillin-binding protein 1A
LQQYALRAFKSHLGKMQQQLNRQYSNGSDKASLDALVNKELKRLKLTEVADVKKRREIFTWKGFSSDSISVRDSLSANLKLLHAGLIAVDPNDGFVKAWVGGVDFRTQPYDQIFAQRQTASAFKPILYASALEEGAMPCQYLDNEAVILKDFEDWQPQNYDRSSGGKYSMAASLSKSMNIPTVNLFFQQDFNILNDTWKSLGFSQELSDKPSVALGISTASLYEMAIAYSAFANAGKRIKPVFIKEIRTSDGRSLYKHPKAVQHDRVLNESTSGLLTAMLAKAVREGTGRSMNSVYGIRSELAGKTGTSQDYGDAWFLAYNNDLVIATRVGASYPVIHFRSGASGSGSALALPIIGKTLQQVQNNRTLRPKYLSDIEISEQNTFALDCPDFIDDSEIEKFFENIFKDKNTTFKKATKKAKRQAKREKNKSWFKRVFGKKE